jgi:hypothetical protein
MTRLFAQSPVPTDLSGATGWVGAGLLGAVLAWLLVRHIPSILSHYQTLIATMNSEHQTAVAAARKDYREALVDVLQQHERAMAAMVSVFQRELAKLDATLIRTLDRLESERHSEDRGLKGHG